MATPGLAGRRPALWRQLGLGVLVLGLLAVLVADQAVLPGETATVEAVNAVPTWVGWPFRVVMQLGTLWAALVVLTGLAWQTRRRGMVPTAAATLAVFAAFRLDNVLKDVVERPRPSTTVDGLEVREDIGGFGFPSGHTTMAFALAGALHPALPARWRPAAWGLAIAVALARLHVGVHFPLDVLGGAALGSALAAAAWLVVDRLPACWFEPPAATPDRPADETGAERR